MIKLHNNDRLLELEIILAALAELNRDLCLLTELVLGPYGHLTGVI